MQLTSVIVADCPWSFGDKLPGTTRGAASNYDVMDIDDICAFPLPPIAPDALLFMWRVSSQPEEALRVVRAWGFVPKTELVWIKTMPDTNKLAFGMGRYVRASHETCIIAARGKATQLIRNRSVRSVFFAPRGAHSEKPQQFFDIVESMAEGPYCELFARTRRNGWLQYGNQLEGGVADYSCEPVTLQP